ncbi:MAG: PQQ-binding-like beta-propeller repeat protein [Verrucomicrobia bacterium]|nr:PQQ-binding-like beta-propeller repeat protein [Verrucomicrobiota bacterium]
MAVPDRRCRAVVPGDQHRGADLCGSDDRRLYALEAGTGRKAWEFATGGAIGSSPAIGEDGTVYVQSDDGRVYAVIGATGQELWEYRISTAGASPSWHSSPAVGEGGTVYVESSEEVVHALNGATGQLVWTFPTGGLCVDGSPVIGADGSICVPANVPAGGPSSEMRLYALDPANGRIRWQAGGLRTLVIEAL